MKAIRIHAGILALFLTIFFWGLNAQYPLLGHDYFYFWPRILEGKWHFLRQGFAPLRFAPHLCGGFFQYGNPQDVFYSLPQLLSFFLPLWTATQLSIAVAMIVGYIGWVRFGRDVLELSRSWALTLAIVCTANGFFFVHIAVGHLSYFTLPLMSWMLWALFHRTRETGWLLLERAIIFAAVTGTFLYSGTHIAWFIVIPLIGIFLPMDLLLSNAFRDRVMMLLRRIVVFLPCAIALGASKLVAIWSLMHVLPRTVDFQTYTAGQNSLLFAIKSLWIAPQLPQFFTLDPINRIHEESMFTSPVALFGSILLVVFILKHRKLQKWKKIAVLAFAAFVTFLILAIVHGKGIVPQTLQTLPLFSSLRVPERFLVILSLLTSIAGVLGCALWFQKNKGNMKNERAALIASAITVFAFATAYIPLIPHLEYTVPYDQIVAGLKTNPDPMKEPVQEVQDLVGVKVSDFQYFFAHATGSRCYETIQSLNAPPLRDGPVNLAWS
ncbi:MAG: hypothetical protein Greene101449_1359, partial [Candidatus Peregrinibacteria bacterium Greene1014_49]